MADNEDYFPRGGKKPLTRTFKRSANFLGAPEKAEKKKKKPKKKSEEDDGYLSDEATKTIDESFKNCGVWLKYSVVREGQLLLGRVRVVQDTKLSVSLPCRMQGYVMACHISEAYNKLLEAYVNDQTDKVPELQQMFRPGQYVALKVLEVGKDRLMMTLMPQHVNSGKMHTDLHKGALLQAAVSSIEDHGYTMDIGIPNVRAFLPKSAANPELELSAGMITWCTIKSISPSPDSSVVTLTNQLEALQKAVQRKPTNTLLPATSLEFTIDKPLDNGIEGHVFNDTVCYVQRPHADKVNGKKPALGQRVRARLLYVLPPKNTPYLTMRNIFATTYPDMAEEQRLQDGDIIEEALVIKIERRSVHFKLGDNSIGILSLRRIQIDEDLCDEDIVAKSYPIGSTHKVRVLCYNLMDYTYSVSDDPRVVGERYFSLAQLPVGELLDGTVVTVTDSHLIVAVGRVTGYVPQAHMTDAGIFIDPKKASTSKLPKKKFKVGQEVRARVLSVDASKNSLFLTLKPSLLTPDLDVLHSYEQAVVGKAYTGVIGHIKNYLMVSFFNNVYAYVNREFVSAEPLPSLADAFHLGQIVNCTILKVDVEKKRMHGSLTTAPFTEKRERPTKNKKLESKDLAKKKQQSDKDATMKTRSSDQLDKSTETEDTPNVKLNKKRRKDDIKEEQAEIEAKPSKKKKKSESNETDEATDDNVIEEQIDTKAKKKKKQKEAIEKQPEMDVDTTQDEQEQTSSKENKKKKKKDKKKVKEETAEHQHVTEESDAIETDIHEDSDQLLTPQDLGLIDMSDCVTAKQYKKRVVSLLKAIKARTKRIDTVDKKILNIENKGLNAKNKKFHTAMHMEKLVIQERMKKLLEALDKAQEKLKEFGLESNKDYKKKDKKKERKRQDSTVDADDEAPETEEVEKKIEEKKLKQKLKDIKVVEDLKPAIEVPSAKDFWSVNTETAAPAQEEESSSSEDEEAEKPKKKRKKLTAAEKVAKAREEEERLRALERRAAEADARPRSRDQFERALLARPNCSQLWIAYMAFHLQATEIDKARAVARKALEAISFREEGERLNVWLALLNLEHRFGTKESQQKTLEEALQMNDTYKVHSKLLDIYVETGQPAELSALVELMLRKYKRLQGLHVACGDACYRAGMLDKARYVMQKGISTLEKKDHVPLLVAFARLERRAGERERAEALLEQVLATYPQRVDVCAVYADMLAATGDVERVRQLMERMTSHKIPARKMKTLYKKWIELEEKIGDKEHVESIRQRAIEFIDKAKF